jgi:hypothetical protein
LSCVLSNSAWLSAASKDDWHTPLTSLLACLLALLCFALLCFALLCFALLCFALLCFALLCFVLLCFALLCFALLCFACLLILITINSVLFFSAKTRVKMLQTFPVYLSQ